MPGLAITAEYRFMGTAGTRDYSGTASLGGHSTAATAQLGSIYNHSFLVGLRYNFGVAPPPPPPPAAVPAQAPARSYLVFFDWDKANLTDRARQIIKEAADNSTHVQYTRIEVNGYTDTSGTPQYNMGLSIRRANAVKAELIKDGVPANAITTQGFGETHLLVPTGPGVREPQNRRVEIIIR
jgi:outer membrane protein OmpA-like peptidoglycan-associated protein